MSDILVCNKCGRYPQPNRPKLMGEKCDYPKCDGRFVAEADLEFQVTTPPTESDTEAPPVQPEMFPPAQANPVLYTRDNLKRMVEDAEEKEKAAKKRHEAAMKNLGRLRIMLATLENAFS